MSRTPYQEAIADGIAAAGHVVEWKPIRDGNVEVLHIDGVYCGSRLDGKEPEARSVDDAVTFRSVWRRRKLNADPKKATASLLDRHAADVRETERGKRHRAVCNADDDAMDALCEAFGEVPGLMVNVRDALATVSFSTPMTPEQAARIGDALRAILTEAAPAPQPATAPPAAALP